MRHSTHRHTMPSTILAVILVFSGLTAPRGSTPVPSGEKAGKKPTQTQRTQKRPAQTQPTRSPAKPAAKPQPAEKPMTFTDEDLKQFHAGAPTAATTRREGKAPASEDPLKPYRDQEERARWKKEKSARIQDRVLELEARLRKLEQKRLSIENPYVPRPSASEGDSSDEGLSGQELLLKTDAEIKEVTEQLEAGRKELAAFLETTP